MIKNSFLRIVTIPAFLLVLLLHYFVPPLFEVKVMLLHVAGNYDYVEVLPNCRIWLVARYLLLVRLTLTVTYACHFRAFSRQIVKVTEILYGSLSHRHKSHKNEHRNRVNRSPYLSRYMNIEITNNNVLRRRYMCLIPHKRTEHRNRVNRSPCQLLGPKEQTFTIILRVQMLKLKANSQTQSRHLITFISIL